MENIRKQLLDNMSLNIQNIEKNNVLIEIYDKCNLVIAYIDENNAWFDNSEYDFSHQQLESLKNIKKEIESNNFLDAYLEIMNFIAYNNAGYEDKITEKEIKQLKDIVIFIQQKIEAEIYWKRFFSEVQMAVGAYTEPPEYDLGKFPLIILESQGEYIIFSRRKAKSIYNVYYQEEDIDVSEKENLQFVCVKLNDLTIRIMNKVDFSKKFNKDIKDVEWNEINPILDLEMEKKQIEKFKEIFREIWNYKQVDVIKYNAYIEGIVDCCQNKDAKEFYKVFKM